LLLGAHDFGGTTPRVARRRINIPTLQSYRLWSLLSAGRYIKASWQDGVEVLLLSLFKVCYSTGSILMGYSMAPPSIFPAQLGWIPLCNTNIVMILCMKKRFLIFVQISVLLSYQFMSLSFHL